MTDTTRTTRYAVVSPSLTLRVDTPNGDNFALVGFPVVGGDAVEVLGTFSAVLPAHAAEFRVDRTEFPQTRVLVLRDRCRGCDGLMDRRSGCLSCVPADC